MKLQFWWRPLRYAFAVLALLAVKDEDAAGVRFSSVNRAEEVEGSDTMYTAVQPWQHTATL
jgi:hypothetical protein